MLKEFLETGTWALVQDPQGLSGKKRQNLGLDKLSKTELVSYLNGKDDQFRILAWKRLQEVWPTFGQNSNDEDE